MRRKRRLEPSTQVRVAVVNFNSEKRSATVPVQTRVWMAGLSMYVPYAFRFTTLAKHLLFCFAMHEDLCTSA